jgi:hypothetical protein
MLGPAFSHFERKRTHELRSATYTIGLNPVEYVAGRDLFVLIGEKTITYNDMLGRSWEVPIVSSKPAPSFQMTK